MANHHNHHLAQKLELSSIACIIELVGWMCAVLPYIELILALYPELPVVPGSVPCTAPGDTEEVPGTT